MPLLPPHRMQSEKGTVLLLALIVMSSVVMSSMGLGSLIISSLQQSRIMDSAAIAYYAAESGAEEALYDIRRERIAPVDVTTPVVFTNGATWTRTSASGEDVIYVGGIPEEGLVEVPLYDADMQASANVDTVTVTWKDSCGGCTVLAASVQGWQPGTTWDPLDPSRVEFAVSKTPATDPSSIATVPIPAPGKLNRLRLRAEGGALDDVRVRGYDGGGAVVTLPGRLRIDVRGMHTGVQQKLLVSVPRRSPLSGTFDHVVFSECSIVKGGTISCP